MKASLPAQTGLPLPWVRNPIVFSINKLCRYNVSKLLEILYIRELAQHVDTNNGGPILNLANPGLCMSDFDRNLSRVLQVIMGFFRRLLARTTEVGARTLVWPTSSGIEGHGQYSADCTFNE